MRSAQRRARIEKSKRGSGMNGLLTKLLLFLAIFAGLFIFIKMSISHWDGENKWFVAYPLKSGDVAVTALNPKLGEAVTIIIPGDTEVRVARNYGTIRIKNIWQLGKNEKTGGILLPETVAQNFLFPVYLWSDSDANYLASGNLAGLARFVFFPKSTNISFGDRLASGFFSMRLNQDGKTVIDMGKSQFLSKTKLNDGQMGYIISGQVSGRLTAYFSDNDLAESANSGKSIRIAITDSGGVPGVADNMGQIIEVTGGKVVTIDKKAPAKGDCVISGTDIKIIKKFADIFSCKTQKEKTNLDVEIKFGEDFAKKY